jgi:hypothetical protein
MQDIFPDTWHELLYIAIYMLCNGNIISGLNEWSDEVSELDLFAQIDDRYCSELFANISINDEYLFFEKWLSIHKEKMVQYDVTTIQTYGDNKNEAAPGRNTAKDATKQVNMAVVFGCNSKLPLIYTILQGNISDKKNTYRNNRFYV